MQQVGQRHDMQLMRDFLQVLWDGTQVVLGFIACVLFVLFWVALFLLI